MKIGVFNLFFAACLWLVCLTLGADELDPSIFDGTGREQGEPPEETEPSVLPSVPAEGTGERGEEADSEGPAGVEEAVDEDETEETSISEEDGAAGLEEEEGPGAEEEVGEDTEPPGTPAALPSESRAGERVESTEKIMPGQAVDFPWDI
jgi:hypothetical protein